MQRRRFLSSSLAASALGIGASARSLLAAPETAGGKGRQYYALRRYHFESSEQHKVTDGYLRDALVPGLNRLGISSVGVFGVTIGIESSSLYVLIPSASVETLVTAEFRLAGDADYMKAGGDFLHAPAKAPAFVRVESSLMIAFEGKPTITVPPVTADHGARVFELRTYESPSDFDHRRKVEMFHSGEFGIFEKAGFWQIFYGDTLIGPRMPNLTYMIGFPSLAERDAKWKAFFDDPDWKKLSGSPRFNFESIVTNVDNLILSPTSYSQI
ncbi:MAG TPA: NIPSNAP family protein [Bryobacteraceae bacterium]|nr:NIPSNAP family protein [Bryobacteraceae bacterium]